MSCHISHMMRKKKHLSVSTRNSIAVNSRHSKQKMHASVILECQIASFRVKSKGGLNSAEPLTRFGHVPGDGIMAEGPMDWPARAVHHVAHHYFALFLLSRDTSTSHFHGLDRHGRSTLRPEA